jgi:MoxR-like ATPase
LLNVLEEGEFSIPELVRLPETNEFRVIEVTTHDSTPSMPSTAKIERGLVQCTTFPLVILTSNAERIFPPAFLRRCLRLEIPPPDLEKLNRIVNLQFDLPAQMQAEVAKLIEIFVKQRDEGKKDLAADQLLNAIYVVAQSMGGTNSVPSPLPETLLAALFRSLSEAGAL